MKILGIIPARYKSSRFPGKPLCSLLGKPMIIWVCEIVAKALGHENTIVATDDIRIKSAVESFGYNVIMTSENCLTGTDRLAEVSKLITADIYINIQGDEPLLDPDDIHKVVEAKVKNPEYIINGMKPLMESEDPENINIPKVLFNKDNDLIYMSRLPIPGIKDSKKGIPIYYKQVCIYAFTAEQLRSYSQIGKKAIYEHYEDIEILRFFDLDIKVKMVETVSDSLAVDVPTDVTTVEEALRQRIL